MTLASFGGVAGFFAVFFFSDVPRVRKDIVQKIPIIGPHYIREIPASDNVGGTSLQTKASAAERMERERGCRKTCEFLGSSAGLWNRDLCGWKNLVVVNAVLKYADIFHSPSKQTTEQSRLG